MEQTFPNIEICILRITIHNIIARLFANKTKIVLIYHVNFPLEKQLKFVGDFLFIFFFNSSYTTIFFGCTIVY